MRGVHYLCTFIQAVIVALFFSIDVVLINAILSTFLYASIHDLHEESIILRHKKQLS